MVSVQDVTDDRGHFCYCKCTLYTVLYTYCVQILYCTVYKQTLRPSSRIIWLFEALSPLQSFLIAPHPPHPPGHISPLFAATLRQHGQHAVQYICICIMYMLQSAIFSPPLLCSLARFPKRAISISILFLRIRYWLQNMHEQYIQYIHTYKGFI